MNECEGLHQLSYMYVHPIALPHLVYTAETSPNAQPTQQLRLVLKPTLKYNVVYRTSSKLCTTPRIDESKQERVPC